MNVFNRFFYSEGKSDAEQAVIRRSFAELVIGLGWSIQNHSGYQPS